MTRAHRWMLLWFAILVASSIALVVMTGWGILAFEWFFVSLGAQLARSVDDLAGLRAIAEAPAAPEPDLTAPRRDNQELN